jgi:phosphatidate cytidylyltransferase
MARARVSEGVVRGPSRPAGDKRSPWRDLAPRVFSAMIMAPLGLGAIWAGGLVWEAALTLLATVAVVECVAMSGVALDSQLAVVALAGIPAAQAVYLASSDGLLPILVVAAVTLGLMVPRRALAASFVFVGLGYVSLLLLRAAPYGLRDVLFLMAVVWANDIGAYVTGRVFGGKRMAPSLSPGKTWSGALGGLASAILAGLGVALAYHANRNGQYWAEGVALLLSVAAQTGDLLESALKRHFGKKDSGTLIPGHGGVLDRVDGLLTAAPVAVLLTEIWRGALF